MLDALFLNQGYYDHLLDAIEQLLLEHIDTQIDHDFSVLDLGCGEGYYLEQIYNRLESNSNLFIGGYGVDISKMANRRAASAYKNMEFVVGSTYKIPVLSQVVNLALSVFSPFSTKEVIRILKPQGLFLRISPGARHLYQFREKIYANVHLHDIPPVESPFKLIEQVSLSKVITITSQKDIGNLLTMTPLNWHGCADAKSQLLHSESLEMETEFTIQLMKAGSDDNKR